MRKKVLGMVAAIMVAISLGGCSAVSAVSDLSTTQVGASTVAEARNSIYGIENAYAAALVITTAYVKLPPCELPRAPELCSSSPVVRQLVKAQGAVSATLGNAHEVITNAKGTSSALSAAVSAAGAAYDSYKAVMAQYAIK